MNCPRCKSSDSTKNGIVGGRQRYRCSGCGYNYTVEKKSKAETYTVEGYNSIFRHFLARLRRKSKCYTKSIEMLKYSIILLMKYRNNELSIFN
ncbi:hypothetical protein [uncultured Methanolobus sp.]|uniref:IS1/IS1595 family N-terminal zinc-binding domain-containing protein n=1 Tax=uncultured Methanolobus sp. TaxID=218300 RepID=UPI002AAB6577|nr:hypothetical protein [uncultured Methanolobus sp.]